MQGAPEVLVVGGGVVGTSVAYFAVKRGLSCTVLEKGTIGGGASNAASGVLSPSPGNDPYACLGKRSHALFEELAPVLKDESGIDIELAQCGELILALNETDVISLQGLSRQLQSLGDSASWIESEDVIDMEPVLNPAILGAVHSPKVSRVNNQRLADALSSSAARHGAAIRQGVEVTGLIRDGGRVVGAETSSGPIWAEQVVLAAGAWTGSMDWWLFNDRGPSSQRVAMVRPVKGVNLNLQPRTGNINSVIHGSWGLLVPRNDGSMIVGATISEMGFDSRVTGGDVRSILGIGTALVPSLDDADLNWALAGLRPASGDDLPVIGRVPHYDNVFIASGHFRNGILLCLATGEAVANLLCGSEDSSFSAFDPVRFF